MLTSLESKLMLATQLYYQDGSSFMTDAEWDEGMRQLKELKPNSELFTLPSHGYDINKDTTYGERLPHRYYPVAGLTKAYKYDEVNKAILNKPIISISAKLDGMSVALYYIDGKLDKALTRGNYTSGIDITDKVLSIIGNHLKIDDNFTGGVRGEIIMSKSNYEKYCEYHVDAKNPRNVVAGIINSKGVSSDIRYLDIIVYTVLGDESHSVIGSKMNDIVYFLTSNFTMVAPYEFIKQPGADNYFDVMQSYRDKWVNEYPYEIDGVVVTSDITADESYRIGYVSQAMKFQSESATSEVIDVEWTMSKIHYAIPRVKINPVELDGTTVQYATGFNAQYIQENKIGPGAVVEISKHGEIIPNIDTILTPANADSYVPDICPDCGEPLSWEGVHLKCTNIYCGNAVLQDVLAWLNYLVPMDNFGDKLRIKYLTQYLGDDITVESIMQSNKLKDLSKMKGSINKLMQKQMVLFIDMLDRLYHSRFSVESVILALNIPRLGDITARKIADANIFKIIVDAYKSGKFYDLDFKLNLVAPIVGNANTDSLYRNAYKLDRIAYIYDRINWNTATTEFKGKVAITGKLSVKRDVFEKELKSAGWVLGEISKDTKYLITDNPNSSSSKNKKADQWGITKITEADFRSNFM